MRQVIENHVSCFTVTVLIPLLLALCSFPTIAQHNIDSIENATHTLTGIQKAENLIKFSEYYLQQKPQVAQKFAQEALSLSQNINELTLEAKSRMALANAFRFQRKFNEVLNILNPTLPTLDKLDNELIAEILSNIGIAHYQLGHDTVSMDIFFGSKSII